ncbi:MAG: DnaD domain protein, partial [Dehalococcoidia bacterium]
MARKRQIDPGIWTSEQFIALSVWARLLFIGMISHSDDEGRMKASPAFLKTIIFPGDSCTIPELVSYRSETVTGGLINLYEIDGIEYLNLPNWKRFQYISKPYPSKIPPPPKGHKIKRDSCTIPEPFTERSENVPALQHSIGIGIDNGIGIEDDDDNGAAENLSSSSSENQEDCLPEDGNIFTLYEQEIGDLTPGISELLKDAETEYPSEWISGAIKLAATQNKRNWSYIKGIL